MGNTCYMNATLQMLAVVEPWALSLAEALPALCASAPPEEAGGGGGVREDIFSQMAALFEALHSQRYTTNPTATSSSPEVPPGGRAGYIMPTTLRRLLGKGHTEFSSSRQQDAAEFVAWLFTLFSRAEKTPRGAALCSASSPLLPTLLSPSPEPLFHFVTQRRIQCLQSGLVRYALSAPENCLRLNIPEGAAVNSAQVEKVTAARATWSANHSHHGSEPPEAKRARLAELVGGGVDLDADGLPLVPKLLVPFSACLATASAVESIPDYLSPATGLKGPALASNTLTHLPPYLLIVLNRYKMFVNVFPLLMLLFVFF